MLVYKYFIQLLWKNTNCGKITDEQLFCMLTNVVKINNMELIQFNKKEMRRIKWLFVGIENLEKKYVEKSTR